MIIERIISELKKEKVIKGPEEIRKFADQMKNAYLILSRVNASGNPSGFYFEHY
jgi:HEPN domain-containing protein